MIPSELWKLASLALVDLRPQLNSSVGQRRTPRQVVLLELLAETGRRARGPRAERCGRTRCGLPPIVQCDNGTEFTSTELDHWAYWNRVQLDFSRPGKPVDNSVCEAFNGSLRRECLTRHWFASLLEAQTELSSWREDYNNHRPHTSLRLTPPSLYRVSGDYLPRSPH